MTDPDAMLTPYPAAPDLPPPGMTEQDTLAHFAATAALTGMPSLFVALGEAAVAAAWAAGRALTLAPVIGLALKSLAPVGSASP